MRLRVPPREGDGFSQALRCASSSEDSASCVILLQHASNPGQPSGLQLIPAEADTCRQSLSQNTPHQVCRYEGPCTGGSEPTCLPSSLSSMNRDHDYLSFADSRLQALSPTVHLGFAWNPRMCSLTPFTVGSAHKTGIACCPAEHFQALLHSATHLDKLQSLSH